MELWAEVNTDDNTVLPKANATNKNFRISRSNSMRTLDLGGILIVSERPLGEGPLALPLQYPFPGRPETYERVVRGAQPAHTGTVLVAMRARERVVADALVCPAGPKLRKKSGASPQLGQFYK